MVLTSYGSAKAGIFGLMRSLALEGKAHGITANTIFPVVRTRMAEGIDEPALAAALDKYFLPEHVSALVVWWTHQDNRVTNEAIIIGGGRARRLEMVRGPTLRPQASTPEAWAELGDALTSNGPLLQSARRRKRSAKSFGMSIQDSTHTLYSAAGGISLKHEQPRWGRPGRDELEPFVQKSAPGV